MGYYINHTSDGKHIGTNYSSKVASLINAGAKRTDGSKFEENLVCVVDNGLFAAAGYVFSEDEYKEFSRPDGRERTWLIVEDAKKLSGF